MKGRASFSLLRVEWTPEGKRKSSNHVTPELLELNERFASGALTVVAGKRELLKIREELYAEIRKAKLSQLNRDNLELVERYCKERIDVKVDILPCSRESERNTFWRLASLFGPQPFARASVNEIQRRLNAKESEGGFKQLYKAARALLRYINRHQDAEKLRMKEFEKKMPAYLTKEQFHALVEAVPADVLESYPLMRELLVILFNLGLRISEALALEKADVVKANGIVVVNVQRQFVQSSAANPDGTRVRTTKNKHGRPVVPLDKEATLQALAKWLKAYPKLEDRDRYRYRGARLVHELCQKLFQTKGSGDQEGEGFFFDDDSIPDLDAQREYKALHMLRASHAVYIIEKTGNDVFAANQIGDNVEVMRKHYAGKINTARSLQTMASLLQK